MGVSARFGVISGRVIRCVSSAGWRGGIIGVSVGTGSGRMPA